MSGFTLRKCKWCGSLFQGSPTGICYSCIEKMDEEFLVARDYIYDHPSAKIAEVCEETGIEERTILHFLKEGRLSLSSNVGDILSCENCGSSIKSGRLCDNCKNKLKSAIHGVIEKDKPKEQGSKKPLNYKKSDKMHIYRDD